MIKAIGGIHIATKAILVCQWYCLTPGGPTDTMPGSSIGNAIRSRKQKAMAKDSGTGD